MRAAGRDIDVEMRKRFPAATETKDFDVVLAAAIRGTLDDGIEPRDITATGKDTDTLYSHDLPLKGVNGGREPSKLEARLSHQHVRFGSKADRCSATRHIRFTPNSDRKSRHAQMVMSALPLKADMCSTAAHVCFGPEADITLAAARSENLSCRWAPRS